MQKNKYCALQFSNDPFRKNCIFMKTLCKEEEKSNISVIFLRMFFRNRSFSSFFFSCTVVQNMHFHALTFTDEHVNLQNFQAHLWRIILFGEYFCFLSNTINKKLPFSVKLYWVFQISVVQLYKDCFITWKAKWKRKIHTVVMQGVPFSYRNF